MIYIKTLNSERDNLNNLEYNSDDFLHGSIVRDRSKRLLFKGLEVWVLGTIKSHDGG